MTKKALDNNLIVVSLGGSLIVPNDIDADFLKNFRALILSQIKKGKRFILITGGGKICRHYNKVANMLSKNTQENLDLMGIEATRLNAQLVRIIFGKFANKNIVINPLKKIDFKEKVLVGAGWKPGASSDVDAVLIAKTYKAKEIINLSNIDNVYDKDPSRFSDAKKLDSITWKNYRKIIPKKWKSGLNSPFDPIASKEAERLGLKVVIMNGRKLNNVEKYLEGKKFEGTVIE